jgi:GDP-mannose 6-dehydrogenase
MNISIFGLGYVGCVGMACLAEIGHSVVGIDVSKNKVDLINLGKSPIIEEQLSDMIQNQRGLGRIKATQDAITAIKETDVSFICVGTPPTTNGHLDLSVVLKVAEEIGRGLKEKENFHVVVIRSTVLPGTNEKVLNILQKTSGKIADQDFTVVSNPEFLREGTAIQDYYKPPFTLIGSSNSKAIPVMKEIYSKIEAPFIVTDVKVAELIKYVNNAFHALKITFGNEIGNICKKLRIDSHKVMDIFCMDTKLNLSPYYLKPGFAYGGSCLPKDLKALNTIAHDLYLRCPILENIEVSNEFQKNLVLNEIIAFGKQKIGFLGLSFKAGTDDLRSSPIVDILETLLGKGYEVKIYDHNIQLSQLIGSNREFIYQRIPFISRFMTDDIKEVVEQSEVIVVVNKEKEFKTIINDSYHNKIIYDLVNVGLDNREKKVNYIGVSW